MVLQAIKENFRKAEAFLLRTGRFYFVSLKNRDKLSTKQTKFTKTRDTVWHENFAGSNFCDFSSDPQKFATQKYSIKGDFISRLGTPGR